MSDKYDVSVIIPTFNEAENIRETIHRVSQTLFAHFIRGEIIVVDDNSPDGTADIVSACKTRIKNLRVIVRTHDPGLSQSVVEGIENANSEICLIMDADGSHPPQEIPNLWRVVTNGADIAIGSRYMQGGSISQWSFVRRKVSQTATILARVMFPHIRDPMSGFFAVKRSVICGVSLKPRGYKILLEILGKCSYTNVVELPVVFTDRVKGTSKLGSRQIVEYISQLFDIATYSLRQKRGPVWNEFVKICKFAAVGLTGVGVNLAILYTLVDIAGFDTILSALVSIETSILWNFILNDTWTFTRSSEHSFMSRVIRFNSICAIGAVVNICIYIALIGAGVWYIASETVAIICAFLFNYALNRVHTWK